MTVLRGSSYKARHLSGIRLGRKRCRADYSMCENAGELKLAARFRGFRLAFDI